MADKKELAEWLFSNRESLGLQVLRTEWAKDWLPGFEDVRVKIKVDDHEFEGRGIALGFDQAFTVAGAEALERSICANNQIHSNGVAIHTEPQLAKENAQNELIERDLFLCYFLTKTPMKIIDRPAPLDINFSLLEEKLNKLGIEIKLGVSTCQEISMVTCITTGKEDPWNVIGFGSSKNIEHASQKAILECLSNTVWRIDSEAKLSPKSRDEFESANNSPLHHRNLYMTSQNDLNLDWMFGHQEALDNPPQNYYVTFEELGSKNTLIQSAPIKAFRAVSNDIQSIFYGPTTLENINFDRLERFARKKLENNDINWEPHPIG